MSDLPALVALAASVLALALACGLLVGMALLVEAWADRQARKREEQARRARLARGVAGYWERWRG